MCRFVYRYSQRSAAAADLAAGIQTGCGLPDAWASFAGRADRRRLCKDKRFDAVRTAKGRIMDEKRKKELVGAGIHVDEGTARMMGNEDFYIRLLQEFPSDKSYARLLQALQTRDLDAARKAAHTLKGLTGDLSIAVLFIPLTEIMEALRRRDMDRALVLTEALSSQYDSVIAAIESIPCQDGTVRRDTPDTFRASPSDCAAEWPPHRR